MEGKKWLIINPPTGKYIRETRCQAPVKGIVATVLRTPLDLAYIAGAATLHGGVCKIVDYPAGELGWEDFKRELIAFYPDYLVVNTTTFTLEADLEACRLAKETNPKMMTLVKGAIFYSNGKEILEKYDEIDAAIVNDDEMGFGEIAAGIPWPQITGVIYRQGDIVIKNTTRKPVDLDQLPKPRRDLIQHEYYRRPDTGEKQTVVLVSRGCDAHCIYCIAPMVGGKKVRYRSSDAVVEEIKECIQKDKIQNYYFLADTFTRDQDWVIEFCKKLIDENIKISWLCNSRADCLNDEVLFWMKEAGCWGLSMGIESGSQDMLNKIKKSITIQEIKQAVLLCKKYRIINLLHFMIGFPWENEQTVEETIRLAKELKGELTEFNIVTPLPGTGMYKIVKDLKLSLPHAKLYGVDYGKPILKTLYLDSNELEALRQRAIRQVYINLGFGIRSLKNIKTMGQFLRCLGLLYKKLLWIMLPKGTMSGGKNK